MTGPTPGETPTGRAASDVPARRALDGVDIASAATQPTPVNERTVAVPEVDALPGGGSSESVLGDSGASGDSGNSRTGKQSDAAGAPGWIRRRSSARGWGAWLLLFLGLFMAGSAWALATPEYGSPDEPSHVYRAAGVVRGQVIADELDSHAGGTGIVHIPKAFKDAAEQAGLSGATDSPNQTPCYAHDVDITADCFESVADDSELVRAGTGAGRYNPVYYAMVGAPSLIWPGSVGLYGMRIVSAAICSALLASALLSAMRGRGGRLVTIGVLAGVTPTVLFLTGAVNPNGMEIAAAASLWVALLRLVTGTGEYIPSLLRRAGVAGALLVVSRGLSPAWLAAILVTCLMVARKDAVLPLLRRAQTWWWAGLTAVATAGSVVWLALYGMTAVPAARPNDVSYFGAIGIEMRQLGNRLLQHIGVFGWNDTFAPPAVTAAWLLLLGAVVAVAFALAKARYSIVLGLLFVGSVIGPFFIEATQYNKLELFWQSRYSLPLAIGIPILAAVALVVRDDRRTEDGWFEPVELPTARVQRRRPVFLALVVVVAAQLSCFLHVLIRYQAGLDGGWNPLAGPWHPPIGSITVIAIFGAGILLLALTVLALRPTPADPGPDTAPIEPNLLDDDWSVEELESRAEITPVPGATPV